MSIALENGASIDHLFDETATEPIYGGGYNLPRHLETLDALARRLGLRPLTDFTLCEPEDDETTEEPRWFEPADGLRTVHALLEHLGVSEYRLRRQLAEESFEGRLLGAHLPSDQFELLAGATEAAVAADLRACEAELVFAAKQQTRFHFWVS
jgi:hypothetical protein